MRSVPENLTRADKFHLPVLAAVSFVLILPILIFGIPNSADMVQHYQFAVTFYDSVRDGIWYPHLAYLTNAGYGDIGVRFYPPFSYYVLIFFRAVFGEWFYASCAAFFFWFWISGIGVYLWAKEWFSSRAALFAAIIYLVIPYHINELYSSFLYAEFAASAVLPFCFLFVTRICRRERISDVGGLSVAYALLILTNLPLALIGSISLLIYALASLDKNKFAGKVLRLAGGVALGLLCSSFYWLRMVLEMDFVKHNTAQFTLDSYDFRTNFAFSYLFTDGSAQTVWQLWYLNVLMLLTLGIILPSVAVFYLDAKKRRAPKLLNVLLLLICAVFLSSVLSRQVWEALPLLQKVQFPWRWMAIISLCGVIFNAAAFESLIDFFRTEKRWLVFLTFGLMFVAFAFTSVKIMRPIDQYPRKDFNPLVERLRTTAGYECWHPVWANGRETAEKNPARPSEMIANGQIEKIIRFPAGEPFTATVKTYYYPHWQASTADGNLIPVRSSANGAMQIDILAEETLLTLRFVEPRYVQASAVGSAVGWLIVFAAGILMFLRRGRVPR